MMYELIKLSLIYIYNKVHKILVAPAIIKRGL